MTPHGPDWLLVAIVVTGVTVAVLLWRAPRHERSIHAHRGRAR